MVPGEGLEPPRHTALDPKSSMSTNSTIRAVTHSCIPTNLFNRNYLALILFKHMLRFCNFSIGSL